MDMPVELPVLPVTSALATLTVLFASVSNGPLLIAQSKVRIYVEPITNKGGTIPLRDALIKSLKKKRDIVIANDASNADWILGGFGETYVKGYIGRNHRVRYKNSDSRPIHGGYLSIELKDKSDDTVWSNLVTPSRRGAHDIGKDLAGQIIERLTRYLYSPQGARKP